MIATAEALSAATQRIKMVTDLVGVGGAVGVDLDHHAAVGFEFVDFDHTIEAEVQLARIKNVEQQHLMASVA